ncbi:MAG: DinB family protein [Rhodothermaceae bacterium]|nr:DinB family protein [Rhodothermaceae bacterium]
MRYLKIKILVLTLLIAFPVSAQETPGGLEEGFLGRYNYAANRLVRLAEALPEDVFTWKPNETGMTVEHVFMHIIRYNYEYPERNLGITSPADIDLDKLESMKGKETVLNYLKPSLDYARKVLVEMPEEDRQKIVELYGNDTQAWNVFYQLQVHMAEHLGQLMAYTRMNDIVPPWSR